MRIVRLLLKLESHKVCQSLLGSYGVGRNTNWNGDRVLGVTALGWDSVGRVALNNPIVGYGEEAHENPYLCID